MIQEKFCELCSRKAAVYCSADKAYICWECDAKVHGANFIVARHTRLILCGSCATPGALWSSSDCETDKRHYLCSSCSAADSWSSDCSGQSSSDSLQADEEGCSSDEISWTSTSKKCGVHQQRSRSPDSVLHAKNRSMRKRLGNIEMRTREKWGGAEGRLEYILRCWSRRLGLNEARSSRVVFLAIKLLRRVSLLLKSGKVKQRPDARVALAACLWAAIKLDSPAAIFPPPSLERSTGVPVQLLLAMEATLRPALSVIKLQEP